MYVISTGPERVDTRTTLAGVLAYLNLEPGPKPGLRAEGISVRHVERGAIPVLRLHSGQFAVRPAGDPKAILTSILDEVERFIVRPQGKVLRPHEMSRTSWLAVYAAGRLAVFTNEAVDPDQVADLGAANLDLFAVVEPFDAYEFIRVEFDRRFGYGTNGPEYSPGAGVNSRYEVHVAYALQRGEPVRDCILNAYRHDGDAADAGRHDLHWLRTLIAVPALRGALSPGKLQSLCDVMRQDELAITDRNAARLIALVKPLPDDCTYVTVDDALYAAQVIPPLAAPVGKPPSGDDAAPVSPLAARLHSLIGAKRYAERLARAQAERARGAMSERCLQRETALAAIERDHASFSWPNRFALAVMQRDIATLLQTLDTPNDRNTSSKRALREQFGVVLTGVPAVTRRRRIFELCGFSEAEQQHWEAQAQTARTERLQADDAERARERAEASRWSVDGRKMNGREYVDLCINQGFSQIRHFPRGSARVYYIEQPATRTIRRLQAKDGTLDYARSRLAVASASMAVAA
ncbi:hypothetical protein CNE_BB2p03110 (plasmid) [Cupriavidus necator N-1]|uniref:Uncharacterized protein n=2 Tax=Cupriavidus necator TaxID=106590 RepID=F8GZ15_CUPNN|nr:hypothetical protein [Cupriavidus necator]AEI83106.1 hypothetical protein CNE_BB2p03110 [Cupriavidus necator N-1]MDX6008516.1 hypothetical protein [Cupriavidus necator]